MTIMMIVEKRQRSSYQNPASRSPLFKQNEALVCVWVYVLCVLLSYRYIPPPKISQGRGFFGLKFFREMIAARVPYYRQQILPHSNLLDPHFRSQFASFFVFCSQFYPPAVLAYPILFLFQSAGYWVSLLALSLSLYVNGGMYHLAPESRLPHGRMRAAQLATLIGPRSYATCQPFLDYGSLRTCARAAPQLLCW